MSYLSSDDRDYAVQEAEWREQIAIEEYETAGGAAGLTLRTDGLEYDPLDRPRAGLDRTAWHVDGDVDSCPSARTENRF